MAEATATLTLARIKKGQQQCKSEEDATKPAGDVCENVRGLSTEQVLSHPTTKRRAKTLVLRTLHQYNEDDEQRYQNMDH